MRIQSTGKNFTPKYENDYFQVRNKLNFLEFNTFCLIFTANLSLPELLQTLDFNPRLIAVEYNGEILHRQFWDSTIIQNDDRLEVVTIVGGGCYHHEQ